MIQTGDLKAFKQTLLSFHLLVTKVMHPGCHIHGKLQQLLGGEGGSSAVFFGKGRVGLQHSTFPQEVQQVSVWSIFYSYVQVA